MVTGDHDSWLLHNRPLAHQTQFYWSARRREAVQIGLMHYVHAGQAAAKLLQSGLGLCPLVYALMHEASQGFFDSVEQDDPDATLTTSDALTLEAVFDVLAKVDEASPTDGRPLHPIARARIVLDELTQKENR